MKKTTGASDLADLSAVALAKEEAQETDKALREILARLCTDPISHISEIDI